MSKYHPAILLLNTFDSKDWRMFRKFLQSPIYNHRQDVIELFDVLNKSRRTHQDLRVHSREGIWKAMFPNKVYQAKEMSYMLSFLNGLLKDYMAWIRWKSRPSKVGKDLYYEMKERGLGVLAAEELAGIDEGKENQKHINAEALFDRFEISTELSGYRGKTEGHLDSFKTSAQYLMAFYQAKMLFLGCSYRNRVQNKFGHSTDPDWLLEVLEDFSTEEPAQPVTKLFYHAYHMLGDVNNEEHENRLEELIQKHSYGIESLQDVYSLRINQSIRAFNSGDKQAIHSVMSLYQDGLKLGLFHKGGRMKAATYINIVATGTYLSNFNWTKRFMTEFKQYLPEAVREQLYLYNLAVFHYRKGEYSEAMDLLREVSFTEPFQNLEARKILLKIYFELDEMNALANHLATFKAYLYRNKNLTYHKSNYLNLVKFTEKLINTMNAKDKKRLLTLKAKVMETSHLVERNWLIAQIDAKL